MSSIAIVGGHGKVALRLTPLLTGAGHDVTSIIRKPEQAPDVEALGARAAIADVAAMSTEEIAGILSGHTAVVWAAGAGGGSEERTYAIDRDAAIRSIDAAVAAGVPRYVMLSYKGAGPDHGVPSDNSFHAYAESKAAADEHLRGSQLAWTIVGPSALTDDDGTGRIEVGGDLESTEVSRDDVAQVIASVVGRPSTVGRFIEFNNGDTPVAEALDSL
ncbi:SDR family oxidoreductase [Sanguibacter suaedae]|uniref:SDR family oxidoreductase n=1 Tax=Sanguibacter suaedae TaxID=2795737 RepID=A0A934I6I1_9MICO|nr:SDR family oxidoreductase [Sanguibacter suaedae]MBI9116208.1 SDR family oxidoreductase [Sanguibacter suaedae]